MENRLTVETKPAATVAAATSDREFVKGLGDQLHHAGNGVDDQLWNLSCFRRNFARSADSPGAVDRRVAHDYGFLTITAALSYGELAAMMPHAGGQYVYLREALGPLWGFLYGWTLFLVIQTGTIAAVGVAFGKFFGVFFPWISSTHWLLHLFKVPPIPIGHSIVLGNMDVGINTQNLMAIIMVIALSVINIFGVKTGALIENIFTFAKVAGLLGLVIVGLFIGRNAAALAANFGANFWQGVKALHPIQVGAGGPLVLVSTLTILAAVAQVGSLFSADAWNNVTFTAGEVINPKRNLPLSLTLGTGVVIALYIACNVIYLSVLPLHGSPDGATILQRGIQHATEDRVATAALTQMFGSIGGYLMAAAIIDFEFRLQ